MRSARLLPFLALASTSIACTAILGDFDVSGSATPAGTDGGGGGDGSTSGPVTITPADTKIGVLRPFTFAADGDVTWSVDEGKAGGSVDDKGKYVSPEQPGVYHVTATSKADSARKATATVTVVPLGINLVAGKPGGAGNIDGPASHARFRSPEGLAVVNSGQGDVFIIADTGNTSIRRYVRATNKVTTLAGASVPGTADGPGATARFRRPTEVVALDNSQFAYVLDEGNDCIRKIDVVTGDTTTLAGRCGASGHQDSTDGTGKTAFFSGVNSMVVSPSKLGLYVCEIGQIYRGIRYVEFATGKTVSLQGAAASLNNTCNLTADIWAGKIYFNDNNNPGSVRSIQDTAPYGNYNPPILDTWPLGPGTNYVTSMAADTGYGNQNDLYFVHPYQPAVYSRNIAQNTPFTLIAGSTTEYNYVDGDLAQARFLGPSTIVANSPYSTMYVVDRGAQTIRSWQVYQKKVSTVLGVPVNYARVDGPKPDARLTGPFGVAVDDAGTVFIGDSSFGSAPNNTIRKVDPATGAVSTLAGVISTINPSVAPTDGPHDQATFGLVWDLVRVGGDLFVLDVFGQSIRRVSIATGQVKTLAGELGVAGESDGVGVAAHFKFYDQMSGNAIGGALTTDGTNLYVADIGNFAVRKVVIATGEVSTVAGGTKGTTNGIGKAAQFVAPSGIALEGGMLYVADNDDNTIRKLDPKTGEVTSFMGLSGTPGIKDGDAATATFTNPQRLVGDGLGNLYLIESGPLAGGVMRRIDVKARVVSPFAGARGQQGLVPAPLPSTVNCPSSFTVDKKGDLLFTDACDGVVAAVSAL